LVACASQNFVNEKENLRIVLYQQDATHASTTPSVLERHRPISLHDVKICNISEGTAVEANMLIVRVI